VTHRLRVLIANERQDRIALLTKLVVELGHVVSVGTTNIGTVGELAADEHPDVALVGAGSDAEHALALIERIVGEAACPVIAVLGDHDAEFIDEVAKRGVFAYVVDGPPEALGGALDIALSRYAAYHDLRGAFGRRALIERAKGILMESYQLDERRAFGMLRDYARTHGLKVVRVAQAIVDGDLLRDDPEGSSTMAQRGRVAAGWRRPEIVAWSGMTPKVCPDAASGTYRIGVAPVWWMPTRRYSGPYS
jgi:response regulator NasT